MKDILINPNDIAQKVKFFGSKPGRILLKGLFKLFGADKVNAIYDASKHLYGIDFVNDMVEKLDIKTNVENLDVINQFESKAFITVSNHPFGHIDGILAIHTIAKKRPDYKVMVNWLLTNIDTMEPFFIGVNPYSKDSKMSEMSSSLSGVKLSIQHLKDGHPMGFFPAGGVSSNYLTKTEDREWQEPVLKLIKKAKVPIIPMYFAGNNSWIYRTLGFIDWRIRTGRLLHEVTNKRGKTLTIRLGEPIMPDIQSEIKDLKEFGEFLKNKTYELKK